jgi:hypothetical protein
MTEPIVGSPFLRVGEHLVGLLGLFELLFRRLVPRVSVGVMLHGELSISLLKLLLGNILSNA